MLTSTVSRNASWVPVGLAAGVAQGLIAAPGHEELVGAGRGELPEPISAFGRGVTGRVREG